MNTPNLEIEVNTDALGGDLRPLKPTPRPIHHPETSTESGFGGGR